MARQTITVVTDDLTGQEGAKTFHFAVGNERYEIDLMSDEPLREALRPLMNAGRRVRSNGNVRTLGRRDTRAIRLWAAEQGIALSSRGRIPADVEAAYNAAQ